MDLWGSNSNPILNGQLHYPTLDEINRPLNEDVTDKIRDYRTDYNNRPSNAISFMTDISITSDLLHCEFMRIYFCRLIGKPFFYYFRNSICEIQPGPLPSSDVLLPFQI